MSETAHIIRGTILLVALGGILVWLCVRSFARSDDRRKLIVKWLATLVTVAVLVFLVRYLQAAVDRGLNYGVAFFGAICAVVLAIILTIIWRHSIAAIIARPFGAIFDGGSQEVERRPLYSIAKAKRNRGYYTQAVAEIRRQLEQFPKDVEGHLLLAEIQAENLNDLPGAEVTIHRLCTQPGHSQRSIAVALNSLADWHLKYGQDREAAKQDLEKIISLMPNSEMSMMASQRLAHLAGTKFILEAHDRPRIAMKSGVSDMGLLPAEQQPKAPEADPARQAAEYVEHLREHPLDAEAREKLALIYANHYGRLDLATDQLDQLIAHPNQPARQVVHWLNLLADLQVQHSGDYETIRQTVQRIIDLFPGTAAAQTARNRLDYLRLELKGKQKSPTVKVGSYDQDLGLKHGSPNQL